MLAKNHKSWCEGKNPLYLHVPIRLKTTSMLLWWRPLFQWNSSSLIVQCRSLSSISLLRANSFVRKHSIDQTWKIKVIRGGAVRETCVSQQHGDPFEDTSNPPTSKHYLIEGFKEVWNCSPIMPMDASLSDSRCKYFQSGHSAIIN